MSLSKIIADLYSAFEQCERPEHFTNFEHCEECHEHDQTMLNATLMTLNSEHLGQVGWAPWSFLTVEGFAHYMPRIVELAITGVENKCGDLFLVDILLQLAPEKDYDRFTDYSIDQCKAIHTALVYSREKYSLIIAKEFWEAEVDAAIEYWSRKFI